MKSRLFQLIPALLAWCAGLVLAFYPMFLSGFERIPGDFGDARLVNYLLEHGYRWVLREPLHADLWSPPVFYPHANTAAYSDILLTAGPFYWCWRVVGFAPETAFQLWMLTIVTLNYWIMYLFLTRCLRLSGAASALGAFLFTFASSRLWQLCHMQLHVHFFSIICLYALYRLFEYSPRPTKIERQGDTRHETRDTRHGESESLLVSRVSCLASRIECLTSRVWIAVFFLSAVCQLYASFYLGWFLGLGLAVTCFWALWLPVCRRRIFEVIRAYPFSLLFWAIVAAVPIAEMRQHYLRAQHEVGGTAGHDAGVIAFFTPTPGSWTSRGAESWFNLPNALHALGIFPENVWPGNEHAIGLGPITTVVVLLGLWSQRRRLLVQLLAATSLTLFVCMTVLWPAQSTWNVLQHLGWVRGDAPHWLGPDRSLWAFLHHRIPAGSAMRAVCRVGLLLLIPASIGLAYFFGQSQRRWPAWLLVLAVVCVLEQGRTVSSYSKREHRDKVAVVVRLIPPSCKAFFFRDNRGLPDYETQLDAMWAGLETRIPTVNGYSGSAPPGWYEFGTVPWSSANEPQVERNLRKWVTRQGGNGADVSIIGPP